MNQCEKILRHLEVYGSITTMEAYQDYGITRLSGRIYDLKAAGYAISSTTTAGKNRFGEPVHFSTYRLETPALRAAE